MIFSAQNISENSEGRRFDRLRLVQGDRTFTFVEGDYQRLGTGAGEGIRAQEYAGLFALPANAPFDPVKPWRLELLVNGTGTSPVSVAFGLDYQLPDAHILMPDPPPVAPWVEAWRDARTNIAILAALLTTLTLIFVFQAWISRSRLAHRLVRTGFLLVVLVWLGWTAGVQLSIVNVMNYVQAPFGHFDIGFYLAEPLMVIVAIYTLISVILLGRGVFCGWLCPFGALQELLAQVSRALRVPQWNPSEALEQRLWMGKYIAAVAVLVLVLSGIDGSGATTEIEPFKTAITSKFTRAWPYVFYAGVAARHRAVFGAGLLPLPVPARRRPGDPRPAAPHRPAQAPERMRQPMPAMRALLSGAGHRKIRQDYYGGMFSVPGLPGGIL